MSATPRATTPSSRCSATSRSATISRNAIELAWNLITKDFGAAPDKLLVTVYHDRRRGAWLWKKIAGLPDERIIRIPTNDNFWAMGDTGPCGPCSEIFYDHGDHIWGGPPGSPDQDGDRFLEIWNLVFMQYEQVNEGHACPAQAVDRHRHGPRAHRGGPAGRRHNYDTDLFRA
jgi:alanyl-tRNA synthetase